MTDVEVWNQFLAATIQRATSQYNTSFEIEWYEKYKEELLKRGYHIADPPPEFFGQCDIHELYRTFEIPYDTIDDFYTSSWCVIY